MSRRGASRAGRGAVLLLVAASLLGGLGPGAWGAAGQGAEEPEGEPVLTSRTPVVATGGTFELGLDPASVPAGGTVELVLRNRARSRSELAASMLGQGLRSTVHQRVTPVSELPVVDGSLRVAISLDPAEPGSLGLGTSGVYPLEVRSRDADGAVLGRLVTHLVRAPDGRDESPPLAVAVVASTLTEPALDPDGERSIRPGAVQAAGGFLAALAGTGAPVNLALSADALVGLAEMAGGGDPDAAQVLADLQAVADRGSVLAGPFAPTSPDALLAAGLGAEVAAHLGAAAAAVEAHLGEAPAADLWLAGPDLSEAGATALAEVGIRRIVVDGDQVEPLRAGLLSLSLAQPYLLDLGADGPRVEALELDAEVAGRLGTELPPALEASHLLAELAMLWFEQPGVARAAVLPVGDRDRPEVLTAVLAGLADGRVTEAVTLDEAFERADPLVQPGGGRVDRELAPEDPDAIARAVRAGLGDARRLLGGLGSLLGDGEARYLPAAAAHLLLATSTAVGDREQAAHLGAVAAAVDELTSTVAAPPRQTITLTARDGTVPLVVRNEGRVPIEATVRLASPKLEFPRGDVLPLSLPPGSTRLDLTVRARASGSIPLTVTITSPDGSLTLAEVDYSIRSTAVAGAGVVLSAGAALFLLVWWARHWHRARRSTKLVEAKHLSH